MLMTEGKRSFGIFKGGGDAVSPLSCPTGLAAKDNNMQNTFHNNFKMEPKTARRMRGELSKHAQTPEISGVVFKQYMALAFVRAVGFGTQRLEQLI